MSRSSVMVTGLIGLIGSLAMTVAAIYAMRAGLVPPLLNRPLWVWGLFLFLLTFSLLEIPLMIFGLRKMAASVNPTARHVVLVTNAGYTLFAGVYALPFILLAGVSWTELLAGAGLASLSFVRFITSVVTLPNEK